MSLSDTTLTSKQSSRGFSLLEVLVAMSIAALSLGVILNLFAGASRSALLNQQYQLALQLAESQIEIIAATPNQHRPGSQGVFNRFHWKSQVTPYPDDQREQLTYPFTLYQIQVDVSWDDRQDYPVSLKTLRLGARS